MSSGSCKVPQEDKRILKLAFSRTRRQGLHQQEYYVIFREPGLIFSLVWMLFFLGKDIAACSCNDEFLTINEFKKTYHDLVELNAFPKKPKEVSLREKVKQAVQNAPRSLKWRVRMLIGY